MGSHWLRAHTHINKKIYEQKTKNLEVNSLEKKPVRIHISCGKQWINEFINDRIIWNDNLLHLNFSAAPFHHSFQRVFFFYRANQNNDAQYTYWPLFLFMVYLTTDMNLALNEIEKSFGKNHKIFFVFIYWKKIWFCEWNLSNTLNLLISIEQ